MDGNWCGVKAGNAVGVVGAIACGDGLPSVKLVALIPNPSLSRHPASSNPASSSASACEAVDSVLVLGRGKDGVSSSSLIMKTSKFSDLWRSLLSSMSSKSRPGSLGSAEVGRSSGSVMSGLYGLSNGHLFLSIILFLST